MKYTKEKLTELKKSLDGSAEDDEQAYDIALSIVAEEEGLAEYLKETEGVTDPVGYIMELV